MISSDSNFDLVDREKHNMKRMILLIFMTLFFFAGCNSRETHQIDDYIWEMISIQSIDEGGEIVAHGSTATDVLETDVQKELICRAKNGILTLTDKTADKTYTGAYRLETTTPDSVIYMVTIENSDGTAVAAHTTYADGSREPTLIIITDGYVLNFFAGSATS